MTQWPLLDFEAVYLAAVRELEDLHTHLDLLLADSDGTYPAGGRAMQRELERILQSLLTWIPAPLRADIAREQEDYDQYEERSSD